MGRGIMKTPGYAGLILLAAMVSALLGGEWELTLRAYAEHYKRAMPYRIIWEKSSAISKVSTTIEHMNMAQRGGYNGVMIAYPGYDKLESASATIKTNFCKLQAEGKKRGLTIIPGHFSALSGVYADPKLGEASPVRGTPFKVANGLAKCASDHNTGLQNGGFEAFTANKPNGWSVRNLIAGKTCFQDKTVKHSGVSSFRAYNIPKSASISQRITVKPFRAYRITAWLKTNKLAYIRGVQFRVDGKSSLLFRRWDAFGSLKGLNVFRKTMNWKLCTADFNSMDNSSVKVDFVLAQAGYGGGGHPGGTIWVDDVKVEEVGLYECMRRRNCPVTVKSADGKETYKEGTDYTVDPMLKTFSQNLFFYEGHLRIPSGSAIQNGQTLKVDWYKFSDVNLYFGETNFCLPETWAALDDNVKRIDALHGNSDAMMMMYDEWRGAFMDDRCQLFPKARTAGDYMAAVLQRSAEACRKYNPCRTMIVESDMYDPYHNARNPYHMCVGGTAGSWRNMDTTILIMNWNAVHMEKSIGFFMGIDSMNKGRANPQLLYAQGATEANQKMNTVLKLEARHKVKAKIAGHMWTTWHNRFEHIELTAKAFKAKGWWGTNAFPKKGECVGITERAINEPANSRAGLTLLTGENTCRIQYELPFHSDVELRITNAFGQTVKSLASKSQQAGVHRVSVDTKQIPAGVYFVSLKVDGRMVKQVRHVVL